MIACFAKQIGILKTKPRYQQKKQPQTEEQTLIQQIALAVSELGWTPEQGKDALVNWATNAELLNLEAIKEQGLRACDKAELGAFLAHLKS